MEPYKGHEPYIFISYARKDKERVTPFLNALSGAGYRVWYDKGISAGDEWLKTLEAKVANCEIFCPLFSQAFNDSYFCFRETSYACWRDKKIVPLYLEEVGENLRLLFRLLQSLQHLRLDDCEPAQFVERLEEERVFKPCKAPKWKRSGQIQWRLDAHGVLWIARNENMPEDMPNAFALNENQHAGQLPVIVLNGDVPNRRHSCPIPDYRFDPDREGSTAPWAPHWKEIRSVEISDEIDAIGDNAFYGCERLTDVHIPERVTKIGHFAFWGCKSLSNVHIPIGVTQIGEWAFFGCRSLTSIEIPRWAEVGADAFPEDTCVTHNKFGASDVDRYRYFLGNTEIL